MNAFQGNPWAYNEIIRSSHPTSLENKNFNCYTIMKTLKVGYMTGNKIDNASTIYVTGHY